MAIYPKINGSYKEMTDCKVKVDGAWKQAKTVYAKVNGEWKTAWTNGVEIFTDTLNGITIEKTFNKITDDIYLLNIKLTLYKDDGTEYNTGAERLYITQYGTDIYYAGGSGYATVQVRATTVPRENKIRFYIYIRDVGNNYSAARLLIGGIELIE